MIIVGIIICLLHIFTSSDAAFTWIRHDASVDFIQGGTAKLFWTVDVGNGSSWFIVKITRNKPSSPDENVIQKGPSPSDAVTRFLSGRKADIDLIVQGTSNVVNVTFVLRNLVKTTDDMNYKLFVQENKQYNSETKDTFLKVLVLPGQAGLQLHSNKKVFCRNDIINMTCNALNGTPSETDLMFFKNNSIITTIAGSQSGNYSKAVLTKELNETGTLLWSCQAKNIDGSSPPSEAVTITVTDPPEITNCKNMTVSEKDNLTLTCDVSGSQPLTTSWFKGNTNTAFQSGKRLSIAAVNRNDSGMYRFTASNGGECATASKTVYLDVQYKPEQISVNMAQNGFIDINEGQSNVNITCSAKGNPEPYYHWVFDGKPLSSLRNDTITISYATFEDNDGKYTCTAVNALGNETIAVTVRVHYIGNATCDAKPNPVKENENFGLSCSAAGYPAVNYTWTLPGSVVYQQNTTVKATTSLNGVSMTCKAMNSRGSKTCTKTITVHYKPRDVQVFPASVPALNINGSFNLTCNASSNPDGSYTWSLNGVTLDGKTNRVLTKDNITSQDAGEYTCTVTNSEGSGISNKVTINVNYIGEATCDALPNPVKENENFALTCSAAGYPPVNYTWTLPGSDVYQQNTTVKANPSHNGFSMTCKAMNSRGSKTCTKTITVHYKPHNVQVVPASVPALDINGSFNLTCNASANPDGNYTWSLNGEPLVGKTNRVLTKDNITLQDAGEYTCTVTNSEGSGTSNKVTINVNYIGEATCDAKPNPIKKNENLTLSCSAAGYPAVNYTWTLPGPDVYQQNTTVKANPSLNGVNITCKAMNSHGSKTCTKTITVHYKPRNVQVVPANVQVLDISGSINLTCSASSNPDGNYTWSLNGVPLIGKTNRVLTKDNITSQDAGEYTCTVTNSEGSVISNKVTINVNYIGEATCDAKPNPVKENENLTLSCSAAGYPAVNYTWTLPGSDVYQQNTTVKANPSHNGVSMTCKAMNSHGSKTCTKTIIVHYKPHNVQVVPANPQALDINGSFSLTCNASSNPDGNYTWLFKNVALKNKYNRVLTKDNITLQDAGEYNCTVTNSEGSGTSNKVTINVNFLKDLQVCNTTLGLLPNVKVSLKLDVSGYPVPTLNCSSNIVKQNGSNEIYTTNSTGVSTCTLGNKVGRCNFTVKVYQRVEAYIQEFRCRCSSCKWNQTLDDNITEDFTRYKKIWEDILTRIYKNNKYVTKITVQGFWPGSVIVNFALTLIANVSDPLSPLKEEVQRNNGNVGEFAIDLKSIQSGPYVPPTTTKKPIITTTNTPKTVTTQTEPFPEAAIIGIAVGCVLLLIIVILLVYCLYFKKRRDSKSEEHQLAEEGENAVPMTARGIDNKGSSPSPSTYAKHGPGANGNNNAGKVDDVYAQVDKSKKTKKTEDEVLYADLSHVRGDGTSGDTQLAHIPSSGNQPEKYESDYAEITGVIRSSETPKENESADNSNKNEKNPENAEKESEAEEQAKDKNQDGSPSTSQTAVDNTVKNDNASGSQINVETKGTSAPEYADWPSTKDRDHTTLTNVSM